MPNSMTAFASRTGGADTKSWVIEMRGVNAKGLDIRLRVPEKLTPQEQAMRAALQKSFARGSISVSLRLEQADTAAPITLDDTTAEAYLAAAIRIRTMAKNRGLKMPASTAAQYLGLRGIVVSGDDGASLPSAQIMSDFNALIDEFSAMRATEGAALTAVMTAQVSQIEELTKAAQDLLPARAAAQAGALRVSLDKLKAEVDPDRLAQELALLAVKSDVTEELDRLQAHIGAARDLLRADGPVGRKLDFLMQEFNREANTLCSKAGHPELTRIGLDLKIVIDQMREQIQNVE